MNSLIPYCPICNKRIPEEESFCPSCREKADKDMKIFFIIIGVSTFIITALLEIFSILGLAILGLDGTLITNLVASLIIVMLSAGVAIGVAEVGKTNLKDDREEDSGIRNVFNVIIHLLLLSFSIVWIIIRDLGDKNSILLFLIALLLAQLIQYISYNYKTFHLNFDSLAVFLILFILIPIIVSLPMGIISIGIAGAVAAEHQSTGIREGLYMFISIIIGSIITAFALFFVLGNMVEKLFVFIGLEKYLEEKWFGFQYLLIILLIDAIVVMHFFIPQ